MYSLSSERFNWAIVGSSGVARQFAYGISSTPGAGQLATVIARDPVRTELSAKAIGTTTWSTEFSDCLGQDVDGVYLAVPLGQHEDLAVAALNAGKATVVEKPLAIDGASARRIDQASKSTGAFCMEAMWPRFLPIYQELKQKASAGDLGEIRQFGACFSGAVHMDPSFGVFDGAQRGGALMHRACYGVSLARFLLGPITSVKTLGRLNETGADAHVALLLSHAAGATSSITASYETTTSDLVTLAGSRATVTLSPSLYRPTSGRLTPTHLNRLDRNIPSQEARKASVAWNWLRDRTAPLRALRRRGSPLRADLRGFGYGYQAAEVVRCVKAGEATSSIMPLTESIEIAEVLDDAYTQLQGTGPS